MMPPLMISP